MSRTKSAGKPRQNLLRTNRIRSTPKPDKSIFFADPHSAPAFPSDIILDLPKGARTRSTQMPPPIIAVRDINSERLLVRKSASAKTKRPTTIVKTTKAKASTTLKDVAPVTSLNRSQPPKGRKTAAGQQSLASTAPEIAQIQHQAAPRDEVHSSCPAAALPPIQHAPVDTPAEVKQLPRSAAVTVYRKNGPIDAIAYWLRSQGRSFATLFKRPKSNALPKAAIIEINRLRLENLLLQRRIEMLMAEQHQVAQ
jgi:hypothetical protein